MKTLFLTLLLAGLPASVQAAPVKYSKISAGGTHTCAVTTTATASCWGANDYGQLGTGNAGPRQSIPQPVDGLDSVAAISAGLSHTCALASTGSVYCWGDNIFGQLGIGFGSYQATPKLLNGLTGIVAIETGDHHSCALGSAGTVRCWGLNESGQLGIGVDGGAQPVPQIVPQLSDATTIAAGSEHTCALRATGAVVCWGGNQAGQLGTGASGADQASPQPVVGLSNIVAISAGGAHTCALDSAGTLSCWGSNDSGELGSGDVGTDQNTPQPVAGISGVSAVAAAGYHTCVVTTGGGAACWGNNRYGQFGIGVAGGAVTTPFPVSGMANAAEISSSFLHTCALAADGAIICWGFNLWGQLGTGIDGGEQSTPRPVIGLTGATGIAAGEFHTCAVTSDGGREVLGGKWLSSTRNRIRCADRPGHAPTRARARRRRGNCRRVPPYVRTQILRHGGLLGL